MVKYYSKDAVHLPRKYFADSVVVMNKNGKKINDTIWHRIKDFKAVNQFGDSVSINQLKGKILVIDFFFSNCPSICPGMTRAMKKLQSSFVKNPEIVQFLSISIDPERDSVDKIRNFADRFGVDHDNWWFLTADKKATYDFALHEIRANIADPGVDTAFIHTENFFLVDSNRVVRGFYNAFDTIKQAELARAIPTLMLEKDRKRPSILRSFIPYLPVIFIGIGITILMMTLLNKKNKKYA